ncbi:hypothetical protein [Actinacidiphila sp. ITFR-21]|uniref:hypothetical protein n=1 Tax=Actinacidiphila sp. ITFR-21 TaxID=3075199 RepID=UPI00288BE3AE|nr:hypothetical protein [Streptomyces sp. ITFR-21]WNI16937.1 hypothetical protein RLT57_16335 [Streptomyces sp. ITFR-21]
MSAHDIALLTDGAALGEVLLFAAWWVTGVYDRRKARRADAQALAEAQAALDGIEAKVSALEARR